MLLVSLDDCVDLLAGFAFKSQYFTDKVEDIPHIKGENVSQGHILWGISKRWPVSGWESLAKYQLRAGDVVVAMDRPWVPAGLKWPYIRGEHPKALLVQRCARLRSVSAKFEFVLPVVQGGQHQSVSLGVGSCCDCLRFDCRHMAAPVLFCCHRQARFSI